LPGTDDAIRQTSNDAVREMHPFPLETCVGRPVYGEGHAEEKSSEVDAKQAQKCTPMIGVQEGVV